MNRAIAILAGFAVAAGAAQAQTQDPDEEQEQVTEEFDESVRTEREEREEPPEVEREYDPQSEYNEPYDKERDLNPPPIEDEYDRRADDPETNIDDPYSADAQEQQPPTGMDPASTADLPGKTVVTAQGEEVGQIEQVGYSRQHDERVATVNVGGFLGAGDKVIAIPISELGLGSEDDFVTTSMDRRALEAEPQFDASQLVTGE